jgi:transcription initiation factor TFIIIB Brf1 subunit/transcription initiation factor TFIIB
MIVQEEESMAKLVCEDCGFVLEKVEKKRVSGQV